MTDIPGAHNRLWHPELAKRDAEAEKVKPSCEKHVSDEDDYLAAIMGVYI